MTVSDISSVFDKAETLDQDDVAELSSARQPSGLSSKLVLEFADERDEYSVFIPAGALGPRRVKDEDSPTGWSEAPYDVKSLQFLAGNVRDKARELGRNVNAAAKRRNGAEGLLLTREAPPAKREGVGRPKGTVASEVE